MKKKMIICLSLCTVMLMSCSLSKSNDSNKSTENKTVNETTENQKDEEVLPEDNVVVDKNMSQKVKDYILVGQTNKAEAEQLKWSARFLENVDIDSLYNEYVANGGNEADIEKVAEYVTENAPIQDNWQEMFEEDFNSDYGEKIINVEYLEGDLYEGYVLKDGKEVPYVTVNARTGYYHG